MRKKDFHPQYLITRNKETCYGCLACIDMCPSRAMSLYRDEQGYYYPNVDASKCIECGRCKKICPNEFMEECMHYPVHSFAGIIKDKSDFSKSSSGGAFKAIIKACVRYFSGIYKNIYCAGCIFDSNFQVVHDVVKIDKEDDVDIFSKSKYVQSNPVGIFKRCKSIIEDKSNFLIFTGTPCQVAAFNNVVGGGKNMLTIDIICHGAPSQSYFDKYTYNLEQEYKSKLISYEFKTKEALENGTLYTRSCRYKFQNGVERKLSRLEDPYLVHFYNETYTPRPSCVNCNFKRGERCSDITIGDAWRINKIYPELIPTTGISVVILSTGNALHLANDIRNEMTVYELDYEFISNNNEPLQRKQ